jgi:hypothetical protein
MPEPHVEMRAVHDGLTANRGDLIVKAELRGRWLEEHPDHTPKDYYDHIITNPDDYKASLESIKNGFESSIERVELNDREKAIVEVADYRKLGLRSGDEFLERDALFVYLNLVDTFKDSVLTQPKMVGVDGFYRFSGTDMIAFQTTVLKDAKAGVDRNATELGAELAGAMSANEEALKGTELFDRLEELKTALTDWNALLASKALPDGTGLMGQAKNCARKLEACYQAHGELINSGDKAANPFVKYQLLAAMRAIGEKVASQYAARGGQATFVGMHNLMRDLPHRVPVDQAAMAAGALVSEYGADLKKAWTGRLKDLTANLKKADPNLAKALGTELDKLGQQNIGKLLGDWRATFASPDSLKKNREPARSTIAEIAFGLGQYKEAVSNILGKSKSAQVRKAREDYQQAFDGFAQQLNKELLQCVKNLQ